jgi:hypothetical protein
MTIGHPRRWPGYPHHTGLISAAMTDVIATYSSNPRFRHQLSSDPASRRTPLPRRMVPVITVHGGLAPLECISLLDTPAKIGCPTEQPSRKYAGHSRHSAQFVTAREELFFMLCAATISWWDRRFRLSPPAGAGALVAANAAWWGRQSYLGCRRLLGGAVLSVPHANAWRFCRVMLCAAFADGLNLSDKALDTYHPEV